MRVSGHSEGSPVTPGGDAAPNVAATPEEPAPDSTREPSDGPTAPDWPGLALAAMVVATLVYSTLAGGGFGSGPRAVFVALSGVIVLIVLLAPSATTSPATDALGKILREPLLLCLLALAALSCLSILWTIGSVTTALRDGTVIAGYAAIMLGAAELTRRFGVWPLACAILALGVVEALLGMRALLAHSLPNAEAIYGVWRPGGSYEYPPALAVIEVSAIGVLPVLAGLERRLWLVLAGAAALVLGASLGASGTRLEPVLAAIMLGVITATRPAGRERAAALAITALIALAAAFSFWVWQPGKVHATTHHGVVHHAAARHATAAAARQTCSSTPEQPFTVTKVCGSAALVTGKFVSDRRSAITRHKSSLLHGRQHQWRAAIETWSQRPVLGSGAGTYYQASHFRQGSVVSLYAHNLALEQAVELGIAGFLLVVGLYLSAGRLLWRARQDKLALTLLGPVLLVFLASNLFDWTWHLAGLGAIWAAAAGALVATTTDDYPSSELTAVTVSLSGASSNR